jgi:glutamate--cysteine ligase
MPASTRSLSPADVHDYVRRHCFTPTGPPGRVGVELELLTMVADDPLLRPAPDHLLAALRGLDVPGGGRLTVEPGGQVELSSLPHAGAGAAIDATTVGAEFVQAALAAAGIGTAATGLDPWRQSRRVVSTPRYDAMDAYFDGDGGAGLAMMCGTASIQVNLDLGDAGTLARRWRVAHAVGPVLVAAFANSPLAGGAATGARSSRQQIWGVLDPSRSAPAVSILPPADAWARYAMAAQVMLVRTSGDRYRAVRKTLSFAEWMAEGHEGSYPTTDDFAYHLTTLFPPVRPKGWLELRMIDALPSPWWQVAVAVTTALLDDPEAFTIAERVCGPVAGYWAKAAALGMSHPALASAARTCFAAALDAFPRLGVDSTATAEYVDRYVDRGRSPADDVLDAMTAVPAR